MICWNNLCFGIYEEVTPASILLQTKYATSWKQYSLMAVAAFSRMMCTASKSPDLNPIQSVGCARQTGLIHIDRNSDLTGLKGYAANCLGSDSTPHIQSATTSQICFGSTKVTYTTAGGFSVTADQGIKSKVFRNSLILNTVPSFY